MVVINMNKWVREEDKGMFAEKVPHDARIISHDPFITLIAPCDL